MAKKPKVEEEVQAPVVVETIEVVETPVVVEAVAAPVVEESFEQKVEALIASAQSVVNQLSGIYVGGHAQVAINALGAAVSKF